MLYHIQGYGQSFRTGMGSAGFNVLLWPAWKTAVAECGFEIGQKGANQAIKSMGRAWLDGHGYGRKSEFDGGLTYLHEPHTAIRVKWGEWGPEHIDVPGNGCGLDITSGPFAPRDGRILVPHNVDSPDQASLLLTVFLFFADTIMLNLQCREFRERQTGKQAAVT